MKVYKQGGNNKCYHHHHSVHWVILALINVEISNEMAILPAMMSHKKLVYSERERECNWGWKIILTVSTTSRRNGEQFDLQSSKMKLHYLKGLHSSFTEQQSLGINLLSCDKGELFSFSLTCLSIFIDSFTGLRRSYRLWNTTWRCGIKRPLAMYQLGRMQPWRS